MAAASLKRCPSKVVDCVSGEVLVGSVYLKSAVGLQCYPNTQIIAALILELKGRRRLEPLWRNSSKPRWNMRLGARPVVREAAPKRSRRGDQNRRDERAREKQQVVESAAYNTWLAREAISMTQITADITRRGISDIIGQQHASQTTMESAEEYQLRALRELEDYDEEDL